MTRLQQGVLFILVFAATAICGAETIVSGNITTTTWTASNSPYRVTAALTVPNGNTLTIEAGVDVFFDADVQFVVGGALRVHGSETDSVRFMKGTASEWGGISISGDDSSFFSYTRISDGNADRGGAGGGVSCAGSGTRLTMSDCVIRNNRASSGGGGVHCISSKATLTNCTVSWNGAYFGGGVSAVEQSDVILSNCVVSGNSAALFGGGVYSHDHSSMVLSDCVIRANHVGNGGSTSKDGGGVYGNYYASITMTGCVISDNTAENEGGGLTNAFKSTMELTNCTISRNEARRGGGIHNISTLVLTGCTIEENNAVYDYGGGLYNSSNVTLTKCIISGNRANSHGGGLINYQYGTSTLVNCIISKNSHYGIYCTTEISSSSVFLTNCTIAGNGAALYNGLKCTAVLTNCIMWGDTAGTIAGQGTTTVNYSCIQGSNYPGTGNISADPLFVNAENGDYNLQGTSPCIDTGSPYLLDSDESRSDMGATGGEHDAPIPRLELPVSELVVPSAHSVLLDVVNTGQSPLTVSVFLSQSFSSSMSFPQVIAASETLRVPVGYSGGDETPGLATVTSSDTFCSQDVVELHGVPGSLISGTIPMSVFTEANSPYHVMGQCTVSTGNTLTIEAGVDVVFDTYARFVVQGAIHAHGTATDSIRFVKGTSDTWGGIKICGGDSSSFTYTRISDEKWADLDSYSGGIHCHGLTTRLTMSHCVISRNENYYAGGLYNTDSSVLLESCVIRSNTAQNGGGIRSSGQARTVLKNCLIRNNQAYMGGGIYCNDNSTTEMTNCTISRNRTQHASSALFSSSSSVSVLKNCIVWENTPGMISGDATITYSCVQGGYTGTGNIDTYPLFADTANANYRLLSDSPCIDTGDSTLTDADGSRSDMGAFAYAHPSSIETGRPLTFTLSQNMPNPFNPATTIPYSVATAGPVSLHIFNLQGQLVKTLVHETAAPGEYHATWNGRDMAGRAVASGVYVYRLNAPEGVRTKRMLLVR